MSLSIEPIPAVEAPMDLLLLADPSEDKVRAYLAGSTCFAASLGGIVVGVCVVRRCDASVYELMNIAVRPGQQKSGYGTALLQRVIASLGESGANRLDVGTGTFGYQLAFYQRQGFRVSGIDRDFFLDNYPEPIIEDGIRHLDRLRLTLVYPGTDTAAA